MRLRPHAARHGRQTQALITERQAGRALGRSSSAHLPGWWVSSILKFSSSTCCLQRLLLLGFDRPWRQKWGQAKDAPEEAHQLPNQLPPEENVDPGIQNGVEGGKANEQQDGLLTVNVVHEARLADQHKDLQDNNNIIKPSQCVNYLNFY